MLNGRKVTKELLNELDKAQKTNGENIVKKKIIDAFHFLKNNWQAMLKFHTLLLMMTLGFYLTYALIWLGIGLPQTDLAMGILAVAAALTEWAYMWWVIHT